MSQLSVNKAHDGCFGTEMRKIRDKRKLTTGEMGKLFGVSASAITAWECGVNLPRLHTILIVCDILMVTPNDLLGY